MARRKIRYRLAFAVGAGDAFGPAELSHEGVAGVEAGEELDCLLKRAGEVGFVFHEQSIA